MEKHDHIEEHPIECAHCKNNIPFELPEEIIKACLVGKLVVFAGSGISTEGKNTFPYTFYNEIRSKLGLEEGISFPALMAKFEKANDRRLLVQRIKQRIDYAKSFPDLYQQVVRFHRELSTVHQINEIITTNWDDFFEKECGAIPIVTGKDYAFWDEPFRKVLKIHGSINNPGSIVATEDDYKNCYEELSKSAVGGSLRHLLATKTILFCGYSLRDQDFNRIYTYLQETMGNMMPRSYIITLSDKFDEEKEKFPTLIKTDATFFLVKLKESLVEKEQLIPDSVYPEIFSKFKKIRKTHFEFANLDLEKDPLAILCISYQDGILHAFERMFANWHHGSYSCPSHIHSLISSYFTWQKAFLKKKRYSDVAYIDGYVMGLLQLMPEKSKKFGGFQMYYVLNSPLDTLKEYQKNSKKSKTILNPVYRWAKTEAKKYKPGFVPQHIPFLMGANLEEI